MREKAEEHWLYTKAIIDAMLEVVHVAYVKGMVHGYKHMLEDEKDA